MKYLFVPGLLAMVACAGVSVQKDTLPNVGAALSGVIGFYTAVCTEPLPEHKQPCETVYPHLKVVTDWYTIVNEASK